MNIGQFISFLLYSEFEFIWKRFIWQRAAWKGSASMQDILFCGFKSLAALMVLSSISWLLIHVVMKLCMHTLGLQINTHSHFTEKYKDSKQQPKPEIHSSILTFCIPPGDIFTFSDITRNVLLYRHTGLSTQDDAITFSVSDGISMASTVVQVVVLGAGDDGPQRDPAATLSLEVAERSSTVIRRSHLAYTVSKRKWMHWGLFCYWDKFGITVVLLKLVVVTVHITTPCYTVLSPTGQHVPR